MKIRSKLLIGFGLLIILMFALVGVSIFQMNQLTAGFDEMVQERYEKVLLAQQTKSSVDDLMHEVSFLVLDDDNQMPVDEHMNRIDRFYEDAVEYFREILAQISGGDAENFDINAVSAEHRSILEAIGVSGGNFMDYRDRVVELVNNGQREQALTLMNEEGIQANEALEQDLDAMAAYHERQMDHLSARSADIYRYTINFLLGIAFLGLLIALAIAALLIFRISNGLDKVTKTMSDYNKGETDVHKRIEVTSDDEIGQVASAFNKLADELEERIAWEKEYNQHKEEQVWLNTNIAKLTSSIQGINDLNKAADLIITELAPMLGATYGAFYMAKLHDDDEVLQLAAGFALGQQADMDEYILFGEGLVGQCAKSGELIYMDNVPGDYVKIKSGIGETNPLELIIHPIIFDDELVGVFEFASLKKITPLHRELLEQLTEDIGVIMQNIRGRVRVETLLQESQTLTEELQTQSEELLSQQEELTRSNEKLEKQTVALKKSEDLLKQQQQELEVRNTELTKKTNQLEDQIRETEIKNKQIEKSKVALEQQALQLILMTRYKSEFLANMSHELRTPLNSLLILSQMLKDNKQGNLNDKQVEYAKTIHASGEDLLKLIDEILDLSKVEAGKMDIHPEQVKLASLQDELERSFQPLADKRGLKFSVEQADELPLEVFTDHQRLQQILRNLLSNAFKFTHHGEVKLAIECVDDQQIAFTVTDTGIGISEEQLEMVFEAFQQADGTTSRKYGGTGLGLSISQKLARLLGGSIKVQSEEGKGSAFSLTLPIEFDSSLSETEWDQFDIGQDTAEAEAQEENIVNTEAASNVDINVQDDRDDLQPGDRTILIVEDDIRFAELLQDMARTRNFKTIVAVQGDEGLSLAKNIMPDAIILDIQLPVMDGWSILHQLKHDPKTRDIPVHVISVVDQAKEGINMGAIAYLRKPSKREELEETFSSIEAYLDRSLKKLLLVQSDDEYRERLSKQIGSNGVIVHSATSKSEAIGQLEDQHYDCMILDLNVSGADKLLETIRDKMMLEDLPIIIYTDQELDEREEVKIRQYAETIVVKNPNSLERLTDEAELFLHHLESGWQSERQVAAEGNNGTLEDKHVLIVDDDIRNVFAISSLLEDAGMQVSYADNGKEALNVLDDTHDLILMDIMMPEMDGYETMREIRSQKKYQSLPIIAVTAKAMRDDREKCIEAGASDYIAKPVNMDQLLSLIRVWLYK